MTDFGVLGPLHVTVNGMRTPVAPRKHRILLASLLVHASRPVHMDELVDHLWPAEPPAGARRAVQTYVMRLRRDLGAAGHLVRTHAEAYSIELAPDQLDLTRFIRSSEHAARARATGNLWEAREDLRNALAQWRGRPLVDVPSAALHRSEVPRLVELRCRAIEQRADLDLELGPDHATDDLVVELRGLVEEFPLRERFWALLLRALRRIGRSAESLAAYHEADRVLGEELGVTPGPELRRLHAEILTGDPIPALPPGRDDLRRLHDLLAEALNVVASAMTDPAGQVR